MPLSLFIIRTFYFDLSLSVFNRQLITLNWHNDCTVVSTQEPDVSKTFFQIIERNRFADNYKQKRKGEIMNALELLKADHDKVDKLFKRAEATEDESKKHELFEQIKLELLTHAHIEETIFYPTIMVNEEIKDIVLEGLEEHKQAKTLLREIPRLADGSEKFEAKFKVLMEDIEHHVEEEESDMFKKVRAAFDSAQLEEMGAQMETEKLVFQKSYNASA
jgi:hemerythrin superfamily protein